MGQAPLGCHKAAHPGPDGLWTAEALRPGPLRNTWPARLLGQPRTDSFQKIPPSTSSGQPSTGCFQNIRLRAPGWYLSADVRSSQTALLTGSLEIPLTGLEDGAPIQKLLPGGGGAVSSVWTPASSFVASIEQLKGLHGHDAPSMGLFEKYIILELHQKFLAPQKNSLMRGCLFRTGAPRVPQGSPGADGLWTAEALRHGALRNTWPARPPGQPRADSFQKVPPGTSSGQPPKGFFQIIQPSSPGRYLFSNGPHLPGLLRHL